MSVTKAQAIVNGVTINLSQNSGTGKWEATGTAPSKSSYGQDGHYYGVTLKAWDDAGNLTEIDVTDSELGEALKLYVKEKVAPVITITSPTAGALITNNKPAITFKVTDDDSGVDPDTIGITIDNGAKITSGITKTPVSGGYNCSYTPTTALSDGQHTIKVDASDNDGNAATQKSVTFKVDTVAPTLNLTSPADNLVTNQASCVVSGTTNDATSSPVTVTVKLNNGAAEEATVGENGAFSTTLTLAQGANTITVVATDAAGKSTTIVRHVTLDTGAPVFSDLSITPNPVDAGKTFVISVTITD